MAALTTQRTYRIILIVVGLLTLVLGTTIVAGAAANATPIALPDDRLDQTVGRPVVVPVVANDVDDDGNLNASSVRIIDPANLASRLTRIVVANEGVWQVSTSTGAVTFTPCTAAGVPDASCTTLFTGNPFPIEYTVKDTSGAESNPAIITITFNSSSNGSPLVIDDQASTERNQAVTIAVLDNDSDPGGALVASTLTVVVAPSAGTAKISSGKIIYTPKSDFTGTDQFAYRVCDNGSPQLCATAIVTVTVLQPAVNNPPVARNDTVTTPQGQPVTISVLANDSDSDGTLNPAALTIATAAGHGTAVANADGTVLYTPNALYSGADQFTYRVCDQGSPPACATATVFVTVQAPANQAPLVRADQAATVRDQAVTIPVLSNDQDPDGTLNAASVTVTTQPAHGATVVNSNGTVTFTPAAGYTGTDTFTYQVCDSATPALCGSAQVTVTVNAPTNQAPNAVNDNAVTLKNTAVAVTVLANDSDPDGTLNTASVTVTSQPNHGNTAVNGSGVVTYTPDTGYTGSDNFTYQVCDNGSPALCDTAVVSVTVNAPANQAPSAVNDSAVTQRNQAVAIAVLGNDRDPDGTLNAASLTVTVAPGHGNTAIANGVVTYTPATDYTGRDNFTYRICDSGSPALCDTAVVSITVNIPPNQAPNAVNDSAVTLRDQAVAIAVLGNDRDSDGALDVASLTVTVAPGHGNTAIANGVVTYTPAGGYTGSDSFTYRICDNGSPALCDTAVVSVTVNAPANQAPNAVNDNAVTQRDRAVAIAVLANDNDPDGTLNIGSLTVTVAPGHGNTVLANGVVTYTPAAGYTGSDTFTYQVCDNGSPVLCDTAVVSVTVNAPANQAPNAVNDNAVTQRDRAVAIAVLANDNDPDGALNAASLTVTVAPGHGNTVLANGVVTYTPAAGYTGSDSFTYQICDNGSPALCDTAVVSVTINAPANQTPVAVDDNAVTLRDQAVAIAVLGNDRDPDGALDAASLTVTVAPGHGNTAIANGVVTYTPAGGYTGSDSFTYQICDNGSPALCDTAVVAIAVNAPVVENSITVVDDQVEGLMNQPISGNVLDNDTDPNGDNFQAPQVVQAPSHGAVVLAGDGSFTYTPAADYVGSDSFIYQLCDDAPTPACDTAVVSVTVNAPANQAPNAVDDFAVTRPDQPVTIRVLDNDADFDGTLNVASLVVRNSATHGQTVVDGAQIVYTPSAGFTGQDSFVYQICDNGQPAACDDGTVIVTVTSAANQPPYAVADSAVAYPGGAVTIDVLANDVDPDGLLVASTLAIDAAPGHGVALVTGGVVVYTPNADYAGSDSFSYQICDNGEPAACATGTINVLVVQLSGVNTAYAFNDAAYVRAGGTVTGNVLANDVDPEADGWQRPVVVEQPLHGDVTLADNGDFSYRAGADYVGDDGWSYQVCDNGVPVVCATAAVVVTVVPANQGPLAVDDVAHTPINTPVSGSVLTNDLDPDGASLTVAGNPVNGPENGTVSLGSDGLFVYTPNAGFTGPDRFIYEVCDSDGRCSQAQVRIDVRASNMANAAPYAQSDVAVTAVGRTVTINVLANDQDLDGAPDPASVSVVTPAEFGTATVNRDGTMSYLPNAEFAFAGSDTFGYQVCDNGAPVLCATASVTVTLADTTRNRTYAFGDTAWGRTNQPIAGMVLENDLDLEGDTQTVKTDPVTNPSHGTATLTADGRFTYTPARDFTGADTFTYRVCDDGAPQACATGTVTLYVLPPNLGWDFGDALGYSTTLVVDGPRHALVGGLALGTKVDAERDALPDEQATTDDRAGGDTVGGAGDVVTQINDEAAIVGYPTYTNNGRYRLDIVVTNATAFPAQLVGWIDWNANFSFDDEGERSLAGVAFTDAPSGSTDGRFTTANIPAGFSGTVTLTWRNFATLQTPSAAKMVRLRLAADLPGSEAFFASAGPTPTGAAIGGAVVDTLAPIATQAVAVDSFTARRNGETVYFDWTTAYGTDLAGFNLLAEVGGALEQLNSTLVPGVAVNSTLPAAYDFSGVTAGETFYLEVVLQSGERYLVGPIRLGGTPRLYLPIVMGR